MFVALIRYLSRRSRAFVISVAVALVALVAAVDYRTGIELSLSVFYLLPVGFAAWFATRDSALTVSVLSALAWFLVDFLLAHEHTHALIPYWNAAVRLGIFWIVTLILSKLKDLVESELRLAGEIQRGFLPKALPRFKGLEIQGSTQPCHAVSGDYFDVLEFGPKVLGFCVADVVGHGVPAALLMSSLQSAVKLLANAKIEPRRLCALLNEVICRNTTAGKFVTFFYARMELKAYRLTYCNAGHNPPVLLHRDGSHTMLTPSDLVLGVAPDWQYHQREIQLRAGDRLVLFTDGLVEVENPLGEQFGVGRLIRILQQNAGESARTLHDRVLRALSEFSKGLYRDDITLLVLAVPDDVGEDARSAVATSTAQTEPEQSAKGGD